MRLRLNSLSVRLSLSAALWAAVAIVAAGLVLTSLYERTAERNFDDRLNGHITNLIGEISQQLPQPVTEIGALGEPAFESTFSGWYWQISSGGRVLLTSRSLAGVTLEIPEDADERDEEGLVRFTATGPNGELIRGLEYLLALPIAAPYDIIVTGNATALQAEAATFRNSVILTLTVFGLALVLSTFVLIRWGLRPLDHLRRALADLRSGKETRLEGDYPTEIQPLVKELNALLESNRQVIERARTQVGNLAHGLKTPLSVITNEVRANKSPLADKVCEQAEIMRQQISHYLDRARIAARSDVIGAVTELQPVVARLARAMNRIYGDRGVTVTADIAEGVRFNGEQQDLEEIIGNLADNACKWAKSAVTITVAEQERGAAGEPTVRIWIDDDGPGLSPEQRSKAAKRGQRLDETKPGSGLGLSIVTDLVDLYGGTFDLGVSPAGGLRAEIVLPAAIA